MVSLVAIEEALEQVTEPGIECCAIELPDAKRGAKIVAVTSQVVDPATIAKKLANELPNIALPKKYITVSTFPRMGSGKTDFRGLTEYILRMEKIENAG
jgi:acyl-[acyl-carrier-protein]-phospholipid O-acyltransferase/long-chain-fatty-acid--[acyl-carrier-protein] ligase